MSRSPETSPQNEWTIMFFFAGDNNLSPSMISQLKAIKDAGFQKNTTVLVRFDPSEKGARTSIFEVNVKRKFIEGIPTTNIGDGKDPFVRNLIEDEFTLKDPHSAERISEKERNTLDTAKADEALESFLSICRRNHPAKHYILFLVGHGMIVGSDAFLPDDHPGSAITLQRLGEILWGFARDVENDNEGIFELVGMHSCSMSSIEVAYQLRGTARYMMSTEGISFVGSWPYRQLLKKIFHYVENTNNVDGSGSNGDQPRPNQMNDDDVKLLLKKLFFLNLHNSTDFMFAGFSADLSLCNLNKGTVESFNKPLAALTSALKAALQVPCGRQLLLLAHWEAQSYWQETYTDLCDFCHCLSRLCGENSNLCRCADKSCDTDGTLKERIRNACGDVKKQIDPPVPLGRDRTRGLSADEVVELREAFDRFVIFSSHFGPTYQYSHGLSIYFPWSRPIEDGVDNVIEKYRAYEFTKELVNGGSRSNDNSWLSFLEEYFKRTKRAPRKRDDVPVVADAVVSEMPQGVSTVAVGSGGGAIFVESLEGNDGKPSPTLTGKTSPADSGGLSCNCGSIKNYPMEFPLPPEDDGTFRRVDQQAIE